MLRDNVAIDGTPIETLTRYSRKKVVKICDSCKVEALVSWYDLLKSRLNRNTTLDYCFRCAIKIYNTGNGNPAKKVEVGKKISEATKGKAKLFKDGINYRKLNKKYNANGYISVWDENSKTHVLEHRLVVEQELNRQLLPEERIHHINGDKGDNLIRNLLLLPNTSEHNKIHDRLEKIAFELVKSGVIGFNHITNEYYINPEIGLKTMELSLGFDDIAIKQSKSICNSRLDVKTNSEAIRGVFLETPLIAANMSTVTNPEFCIKLASLGAMGVMHRAAPEDILVASTQEIAKNCEWVPVSVGVGDSQFSLAERLISSGANIIFIDIAHGYSNSVIDFGAKLKKAYPSVKIVIGNTTNIGLLKETFRFADAIKVGIAQGFACETKNTAGCTEKQFSAVYRFKEISKASGIPIISDGAIREPADFVKAIGAGANSVMAGMIFARCPESAAEMVQQVGQVPKKLYAGMASRYVQTHWKGGVKDGTCTEGGIRLLDIGEPSENLMIKYIGALRSGITYAGGNNIESFQKSVEFVRIK